MTTVRHYVTARIISGHLAAGDRLVVDAITVALELHRETVGAALRELRDGSLDLGSTGLVVGGGRGRAFRLDHNPK
jgi:hypothetical protein